MEAHGKPLLLILARDLAANLATPTFVVNELGDLVFYNEAAENILGRRFGVAGELSHKDWGEMWQPLDQDGKEIPLNELPLSVAIAEKRPAQKVLRITSMDGAKKQIQVVAYPLLAQSDEFVGAVAIFWEC